jgi:prephenate dehydrogenase
VKVSSRKPRVTIVGLDFVGASLGMALRQSGSVASIVGHDAQSEVSRQAKKLGAVDSTHWNLLSACEGSDLVVLAEPFGMLESTLETLGPELKQGCVVLDTASVKAPVLEWADKYLPPGVFYVGGHPIVVGPASGQRTASARADLFRNRAFCLTPSPQALPEAIKLVTDMVTVIGANPLFLDAEEHDGQLAAVEHLPGLVSVALLNVLSQQPAWRELRRVAGTSFDAVTRPVEAKWVGGGGPYWGNRANLGRWIDVLLRELDSIRQDLQADGPEALEDRLAQGMEERERWLADHASGQWERPVTPELPEKPNFLVDAFLGGLGRRRDRRDKQSR